MTTKYVFQPILIETEEQASALPPGTLAYAEFESDLIPQEQVGFGWANIFIKYGDTWQNVHEQDASYSDEWVLGFTALIRVEVEVETELLLSEIDIPNMEKVRREGDIDVERLREYLRDGTVYVPKKEGEY